ncbi:hypothetical protein SUGI_0114380 [Cryptomeria japonica]|nr:hypothetical protein SUGI_0114380 [Cryptomeria japonica]
MAGLLDMMGVFRSVSRFMQRRKYERLNGGRKRWKAVRLGRGQGKMGWRIKILPKIRLVNIKDLSLSLVPKRVTQPSAGKRIENFNDKLVVQMYKSFGIDVKRIA